jgi:hypothetical protein
MLYFVLHQYMHLSVNEIRQSISQLQAEYFLIGIHEDS